ncbi:MULTISPECIES: CsbD family protein [Anaeromyxobacter]|uniref:CsbD family protein n=1 Tax=Anaeromyxobacter dehalogenans (strain ATCC BAA-258 / DSM 21875 / 2CP-1) TaxID=455488 RepID=B8J792_ANAD2|nr:MULTISPECIES: CsbD family protein [Anaeromyxobacter]ACG73083.1 CsbD family protein [Anaeromyxobacter sp. K]ACL65282.1 CsbD family protein [Anaeromyxobacter dehalogenans 2CP-1]GAO04072.1 hypothetical protein PSR1_02960 [Anaeromyxobacter sp. PSR-1]
MNRDQIKGKLDELKGNAKKRIGGATENPSKQAEGWVEEQGGKIRKGVGDLKEDAERSRRSDPDRDLDR